MLFDCTKSKGEKRTRAEIGRAVLEGSGRDRGRGGVLGPEGELTLRVSMSHLNKTDEIGRRTRTRGCCARRGAARLPGPHRPSSSRLCHFHNYFYSASLSLRLFLARSDIVFVQAVPACISVFF